MIRIISGLHLSRADAIAGYSGSKMGRSAEERNIEVLRLAENPADALGFWSDRSHRITLGGMFGAVCAAPGCQDSDRSTLAAQRNRMVLWAAGEQDKAK